MIRAFITGGGGFLGRHISKELFAYASTHEIEIFSYSRSKHSDKGLDPKVVQLQGSLHDAAKLRATIASIYQKQGPIQVIFHTAALTDQWGKWEDFYETNVQGTKTLLAVAAEFKIPYFIYSSSPSVVFGNTPLCGVDESIPYPDPSIQKSFYARSKRMAEELVLAANSPGNLRTLALRPHLIWGEDDPHITPRLLQKAKAKRLKVIGDGKNLVSVTHVTNAAMAHIKAFVALSSSEESASRCSGKAYFIADERPVLLWDFINQILKANQLKELSLTRGIPFKIAYALGHLCELLFRNQEPPLNRFIVMQLAHSHYFNLENAKRDLGYQGNRHKIATLL
ncbi:MAG: NAD-dependent epimerase/dehydratase family protein [Oligoflexia bacterium]|nr:NAD-dependent epimerase/dehydratase family protein [Oligoflexia bacterium]